MAAAGADAIPDRGPRQARVDGTQDARQGRDMGRGHGSAGATAVTVGGDA